MLARGRDEGATRTARRGVGGDARGIEPAGLDAHRHGAQPAAQQLLRDGGIARVLDHHARAAGEAAGRDEGRGVGHARGDDDAAGIAVDAAPLAEVPRDRRAQRRPAEGVGLAQHPRAMRAPAALQQARPGLVREERRVERADREGPPGRGWRRRDRRRRRAAGRRRGPRGLGQPRRDEEARARATLDIALRDELLGGEHRCRARDAELRGERARRRQARARRHAPREHEGAQLRRELRVQRRRRAAVDAERERGALGPARPPGWSGHVFPNWIFPPYQIATMLRDATKDGEFP